MIAAYKQEHLVCLILFSAKTRSLHCETLKDMLFQQHNTTFQTYVQYTVYCIDQAFKCTSFRNPIQ